MATTLFYLKKFISFFIMPYGFALTLLMISIYLLVKKRDRLALITLSIATVTLLLFSYKYFANILLYPIERGSPNISTENFRDIKYIHILGSGYSDDTSIPLSSRLSESGLKRVIQGVIEYRKHPNSKLIITGYRYLDSNITYSQTVVELLGELGIKRGDIIYSSNTKDTDDEAVFAKSIVGKSRYILVTSASHMRRAKEIMEKHGLNPIPVKTDYIGGDLSHKLFSPSPDSLVASHRAIHEYIGILWQDIKDIFK